MSAAASGAAQASKHVDIDALTAHDPTQFTEYVKDIYAHYREDEVRVPPLQACVHLARRAKTAPKRLVC